MKLKDKDIEVGYLYLTTAKQYRAVLAVKGEFMIYAPSLEGVDWSDETLPFENQPFKKCQCVTFAKKDYQLFTFNGVDAIKQLLSAAQLADIIAQCNAKAAIADLLA